MERITYELGAMSELHQYQLQNMTSSQAAFEACDISTFCKYMLNIINSRTNKQQTRLMALKSRLTWVSWHLKRTTCIQLSASLSLLLSLQFLLIIFLRLLRSIASFSFCANHPYPCPQPLSMFSWTYPFHSLNLQSNTLFRPIIIFLKTCPYHHNLFLWTNFTVFYS